LKETPTWTHTGLGQQRPDSGIHRQLYDRPETMLRYRSYRGPVRTESRHQSYPNNQAHTCKHAQKPTQAYGQKTSPRREKEVIIMTLKREYLNKHIL